MVIYYACVSRLREFKKIETFSATLLKRALLDSEEFLTIITGKIEITLAANTQVILSDISVLTAPIPEPSEFGLLAALGSLALVGTRRRRK